MSLNFITIIKKKEREARENIIAILFYKYFVIIVNYYNDFLVSYWDKPL